MTMPVRDPAIWDYAPWQGREIQPFGDETTYARGLGWLAGLQSVQDWGAGMAYGRRFVPEGRYTAIDSSPSSVPFADVNADLETYRPAPLPEGIFMRHVLEHNPHWRQVLGNALDCFTRRFVLVIFTPFGPQTTPLRAEPWFDISFRKDDLDEFFWRDDMDVREEHLATGTQYSVEHIYYVERCV